MNKVILVNWFIVIILCLLTVAACNTISHRSMVLIQVIQGDELSKALRHHGISEIRYSDERGFYFISKGRYCKVYNSTFIEYLKNIYSVKEFK